MLSDLRNKNMKLKIFLFHLSLFHKSQAMPNVLGDPRSKDKKLKIFLFQ
jgi:hypothetical protein